MKSIYIIVIFGIFISCTNVEDYGLRVNDQSQFQIIKNQNNPKESLTYWINRNYAICLGKGKSPCECLSQNDIAMLYLDESKGKAFIQSSIYHFGMETSAEFDYTITENDEILINQEYPLRDSMIITRPEKIYIQYLGENIPFEKYVFKRLDKQKSTQESFSPLIDMWKRRNIFNATSLLDYPITRSTDSTKTFFEFEELDSLIKDEKVSISCSDDFRYNSLKIEGNPNSYYHLEFESNRVILYDEKEGRNKGEKLNLNTLDRQIFYRSK